MLILMMHQKQWKHSVILSLVLKHLYVGKLSGYLTAAEHLTSLPILKKERAVTNYGKTFKSTSDFKKRYSYSGNTLSIG